ncbi:hypothetical protein AB9P05_18890 [Roseivirga sp. BDSF3-8]|uniref:hypothetical protein n=1 Tax=Roseivirga sp. BDSF3-8 TaxID=3241598 RepID=UPI0035320457
MAEKEGSTPSQATNKGEPGDTGQSKASIKTQGNSDLSEKEREYRMRDKYTDGKGNLADNVRTENPNRNTDKGQQS